MKAAQRRI